MRPHFWKNTERAREDWAVLDALVVSLLLWRAILWVLS
jgi:hypothetical protein